MSGFMLQMQRLRQWVNTIPPELRHGEWECDYEHWDKVYLEVAWFVDKAPYTSWLPDQVQDMLFAIARDNEMEHIVSDIAVRRPETLLALSHAALEIGERNAKWQLADQLGYLKRIHANSEVEQVLLVLVRDDSEYVRRRALKSLARIGSQAVEELALAEWNRDDEHQQWARMNVLWCLNRVGSPRLTSFIEEALQDDRPYLIEFAKKVQRGEVDE